LSLIEKATQRLDELRRAGIEVEPAASRAVRRNQADETAGTAVALEEVNGSGVRWRANAREQSAAGPDPLDGDRPPPRSRQVAVDIERLAALGYLTPDAPRSRLADELRVLKRPLLDNVRQKSAAPIRRANLIMVTSSVEGEGKTFTAINLALSIAAEVDSTVLLIDADVVRPALLERLGLPPSPGLLDLLVRPELEVADVLLRTNVDRLCVLPAGTPHARASELLASGAMSQLLDEMADRYPDRILVFDAPPLLQSPEARAMAAQVGQVLMLVEADRTAQSVVRDALHLIERCPVVMTVLTKTDPSRFAGGAYGQYGG